MFQLVYSSKPTATFEADDCAHILLQSRRNNPRDGVTGALIFTGWHFVQALEGEEEDVRRVFERVLRDKRHRAVECHFEGEIGAPEFGRWTMAFERTACGERVGLGEQLTFLTENASDQTRELFQKFLSKARDRRERLAR